MQYTAVTFKFDFTHDFAADLFIDELGQLGFDSFEDNAHTTTAYIPTSLFDLEAINNLIDTFAYGKAQIVECTQPEDKDWNAEWEKNYFQPIVIADQCVIHSTFHTDIPTLPYDIIINPQMAFGTGHHQTTSMMLRYILDAELEGKKVLDMGCGTAVLAILAKMKGAQHVTAIDIDDWCVRNALENIELNHLNGIDVFLGDALTLEGKTFDVVLANINRNILLNDMSRYAATLQHGGSLYISGFYTDDIPILNQCASTHGLTEAQQMHTDNWAALKFIKQ